MFGSATCWLLNLGHLDQFPWRREAGEDAEEREDVKSDAHPFLDQQKEQAVERVDDHADDKTSRVAFLGEDAEEGKDAGDAQIHEEAGPFADAACILGKAVDDLGDSEADDERSEEHTSE